VHKQYKPMEALTQVIASVLSLTPLSFALASGRKRYPDGYVLEKIRERKRTGKSLDSRFVPQYLMSLVYQRHEDWNQVLKKAGLDPEEEKAQSEDIERILEKLGFDSENVSYSTKRIMWPEGTAVKALQYRKEKGKSIKPSRLPVFLNGLINYRYGGWEDVVREAGFNPKEERKTTAEKFGRTMHEYFSRVTPSEFARDLEQAVCQGEGSTTPESSESNLVRFLKRTDPGSETNN